MAGRWGLGPIAVAGALVVSLTGCSDDGDEPAAKHTSASAPATTAYPSGAPTGAVLTDPGSDLSLAEGATVSWRPRQDVVGTVRISVDNIEPTTFRRSFQDWRVDAKTRRYTPYFVRALVTNVGETDLAGVRVPVYGESAVNALIEPALFKETFKPCHPSVLPTPFPAGGSAAVCLVYLVPDRGQLVGAAFRPSEEFEPIVWRPAAATKSPAVSPTSTPTPAPTPAPTPTASPTS